MNSSKSEVDFSIMFLKHIAMDNSQQIDPVRLKAARRAAKLTQAELAKRVNMDQGHISNLERGRVGVSVNGLKNLARELRVTVKYLMGDVEDKYSQNPQAAILSDPETPAGLRELAAATDLLKVLTIESDEWRALASLASNWRDADLTSRDGWVQILFSLRSVNPGRSASSAVES